MAVDALARMGNGWPFSTDEGSSAVCCKGAFTMEEIMRPLLATLILFAAPAFAATPTYYPEPAPLEDHNSYWLDYKTDVSEAKRELRKDLRRAKKASDRREAWAEYHRELADARKDFRQEMREKGYAVGQVTVTE